MAQRNAHRGLSVQACLLAFAVLLFASVSHAFPTNPCTIRVTGVQAATGQGLQETLAATSGGFDFKFEFIGVTDADLSVSYNTVDGRNPELPLDNGPAGVQWFAAKAGLDYNAKSGTLLFLKGVNGIPGPQNVRVDVIDDAIIEMEERFSVVVNTQLSSPFNYFNGANCAGVVCVAVQYVSNYARITYSPEAGTADIISPNSVLEETPGGAIIFQVRLNLGVEPSTRVTVTVNTAQTNDVFCMPAVDYVPLSSFQVNFDGTSAGFLQPVTVTILDDNMVELEESFALVVEKIEYTTYLNNLPGQPGGLLYNRLGLISNTITVPGDGLGRIANGQDRSNLELVSNLDLQEGSNFQLVVKMSAPVWQPIKLVLAHSNIQGQAAVLSATTQDYQLAANLDVSCFVTACPPLGQSIPATLVNDEIVEAKETFILTASLDTTQAQFQYIQPLVTFLNGGVANFAIADNDVGALSLIQTTSSQKSESTCTNGVCTPSVLEFQVQLDKQASVDLTFQAKFTFDGTASAADLQPETASLVTFPAATSITPSVATALLRVTAQDDNEQEPDETFKVSLIVAPVSAATYVHFERALGNAISLPNAPAIGTLNLDDEGATISFWNAQTNNVLHLLTTKEGENTEYKIRLSHNIKSPGINYQLATVNRLSASNPAVGGSPLTTEDFELTTSPRTALVAGLTTERVSTRKDNIWEVDEVFAVRLSVNFGEKLNCFPKLSPANEAFLVVTIQDQDTNTGVFVNDVTALESVATKLSFSVSLKIAIGSPLMIKYKTVDDGRKAGSGYTAIPETSFTFQPNGNVVPTAHIVDVVFANDNIQDVTNGKLFLEVTYVDPAFTSPTATRFPKATGTIVDDEKVTVRVADVSAAENLGDFNFEVKLSHAIRGGVVTFQATAAKGTDLNDAYNAESPLDFLAFTNEGYTVPNPTDTFVGSVVVPVKVFNDDIQEQDESFTLTVTNIQPATFAAVYDKSNSKLVAKGLINVDRENSQINIFPPVEKPLGSGGVAEENGKMQFPIRLTHKNSIPISVTWRTNPFPNQPGFARYGEVAGTADYGTLGDFVIINPMTGESTADVYMYKDQVTEVPELVQVELLSFKPDGTDGVFSYVSFGPNKIANGKIVDAGTTAASLILSSRSDATVLEGSVVNFKIELTGPVDVEYTVGWHVEYGNADRTNGDRSTAASYADLTPVANAPVIACSNPFFQHCGKVTFEARATGDKASRLLSIRTVADGLVEPDEVFTIVLDLPTVAEFPELTGINLNILPKDTFFVGTILDADQTFIGFAKDNANGGAQIPVTAPEPDAIGGGDLVFNLVVQPNRVTVPSQVFFTVTSQLSLMAPNVPVASQALATKSQDYNDPAFPFVNLPALAATAQIRIPLLPDLVQEPNELVRVTLTVARCGNTVNGAPVTSIPSCADRISLDRLFWADGIITDDEGVVAQIPTGIVTRGEGNVGFVEVQVSKQLTADVSFVVTLYDASRTFGSTARAWAEKTRDFDWGANMGAPASTVDYTISPYLPAGLTASSTNIFAVTVTLKASADTLSKRTIRFSYTTHADQSYVPAAIQYVGLTVTEFRVLCGAAPTCNANQMPLYYANAGVANTPAVAGNYAMGFLEIQELTPWPVTVRTDPQTENTPVDFVLTSGKPFKPPLKVTAKTFASSAVQGVAPPVVPNVPTGADYLGQTSLLSLFADATSLSFTFSVTTYRDTLVEPDETFFVQFLPSAEEAPRVSFQAAQPGNVYTGTIKDPPAGLSVSFSVNGQPLGELVPKQVAEGQTISATITLTVASATPVSVTVTANFPSSASAADLNFSPQTFALANVGESKIVDFAAISDATVETDEVFEIVATTTSTVLNFGDSFTTTSRTSVTVLSADSATFTFAAPTLAAREGNPVNFEFRLSGGMKLGATVSVNVAPITGTAVAGVDYVAPAGAITLVTGQNVAFVPVQTIVTSASTPDRSLTLQLTGFASNPLGSRLTGSFPAQATGMITEPTPNTISVNGPSTGSAVKEGQSMTFTVTLTNGYSDLFQVDYIVDTSVSTRGRANCVDLVGGVCTTQTLQFAANVKSQTFTLNIAADTTDEPYELVYIKLSNARLGATGAAGLNIGTDILLAATNRAGVIEGTPDYIQAYIDETKFVQKEGAFGCENLGGVPFTIALTKPCPDDVTVQYQVRLFNPSTGTAATAADFGVVVGGGAQPFASFSVTVPAGSLEIATTMPVVNEPKPDGDSDLEYFQLIVSSVSAPAYPGAFLLRNTKSAPAWIGDSASALCKTAAVGLIISGPSTVTEGQRTTFTIALAQALTVPATITVTGINGSGRLGSEYSFIGSTVINVAPAGPAAAVVVDAPWVAGNLEYTFSISATVSYTPAGSTSLVTGTNSFGVKIVPSSLTQLPLPQYNSAIVKQQPWNEVEILAAAGASGSVQVATSVVGTNPVLYSGCSYPKSTGFFTKFACTEVAAGVYEISWTTNRYAESVGINGVPSPLGSHWGGRGYICLDDRNCVVVVVPAPFHFPTAPGSNAGIVSDQAIVKGAQTSVSVELNAGKNNLISVSVAPANAFTVAVAQAVATNKATVTFTDSNAVQGTQYVVSLQYCQPNVVNCVVKSFNLSVF